METLKAIQKIVLFFIMMILVSDIGGAFYTKTYYQGGIDFAVKAATMEIVRDDDYANGIIKIDEKSKEQFNYMMKRQFRLDDATLGLNTIYASPINNVPYEFIHPFNGKTYIINEPMFVAVYRVRNKGVFIKNDILIDNLSGSRVTVKPK